MDHIIETGYITFKFNSDYEKNDFCYFIASLPLTKKGITSYIDNNTLSGRTVTLYVKATTKDESGRYFIYILNAIKEYIRLKKDGKNIPIHPDIKKLLIIPFIVLKLNHLI